jgi:hypothetical protein
MLMFGWFKSRQRTNPASASRQRLGLELLETRDVPANMTWLGGDFNVATNWAPNGVPGLTDTIILDGATTSADILIPGGVGGFFLGIEIQATYNGTVEFDGDVGFDSYFQAGGSVVQANNTVFVGSQFIWTDGDIDATGAGVFELRGTTGQIGTDTSSLTCGATIKLLALNNTVSTVRQSGTLNLLADVTGIEVHDGSEFTQKKLNANGAAPVITSGTGTFADRGLSLFTGGKFISWGGTVPSVQMVSEGHIEVETGGLTVTGHVPLSLYEVTMTGMSSTILIPNGETLTATKGVYMDDGTLHSEYKIGVAQTATIDGLFYMNGGLVRLGTNPAQGVAGHSKLLVKNNDARLYGGTFEVKLDPGNNVNRDVIETEDELDTTAGFTVAPINRPPVNFADVLVSQNGFTAGSVDPTNPQPGTFTMARTNNGKNFGVKR